MTSRTIDISPRALSIGQMTFLVLQRDPVNQTQALAANKPLLAASIGLLENVAGTSVTRMAPLGP